MSPAAPRLPVPSPAARASGVGPTIDLYQGDSTATFNLPGVAGTHQHIPDWTGAWITGDTSFYSVSGQFVTLTGTGFYLLTAQTGAQMTAGTAGPMHVQVEAGVGDSRDVASASGFVAPTFQPNGYFSTAGVRWYEAGEAIALVIQLSGAATIVASLCCISLTLTKL